MGAVADYIMAIDLIPDYVEAYKDLGNTYAKQGSFAEAIANFIGGIAVKPDSNRGL